jgi:NitT/TauT family transport system ATP-binding protein
MTDPRFVRFENVGVTFGTGAETTEALTPTSLAITQGEFVALVGPSGCGKSTILKLAAELLKPSAGHIFFAGRELGATPLRVGMAFQSASLLPWMTVRENVMLPLKIVPPFKAHFRETAQNRIRLARELDETARQLDATAKEKILESAAKYRWNMRRFRVGMQPA